MNRDDILFTFPFISGSETGTSAVSGTVPENKHKNTSRTDEQHEARWSDITTVHNDARELPRRVSTAAHRNQGAKLLHAAEQGGSILYKATLSWQSQRRTHCGSRFAPPTQRVQHYYVIPLKPVPWQHASSSSKYAAVATGLRETGSDIRVPML